MTNFTIESLDENNRFDLSQIPAGTTRITVSKSVASLIVAGRIVGFNNKIPDGCELEELDLSGCKKLETLDLSNLPTSLKKLILTNSGIKTLTGRLPDGCELEELDLSGCKKLETLDLSNLPASLKLLILFRSKVEVLTGLLPSGCQLKTLDLMFCEIKTLDLSNLSTALELLNLASSKIETLTGSLPYGYMLKALNLDGCKKLEITTQLLSTLEELTRSDCAIYYPQDFHVKATSFVNQKLKNIIQKAKTQNPSLQTNDIEKLFERFLGETEERYMAAEIVNTINPILTFLEANPLALEWMNNISSVYLDACVNQPVNGMLEIAAFVEIAQAETITKKLEAATRIVAQDALKEFMAKLPPERKPGSHVEVEAGNALLREVHEKLLEEGRIHKPWSGIPYRVAYEGTIESWLTPEIIKEAYEEILPKLQRLDIFHLKELMCETNHKETWAMVAFPAEYKSFKKELDGSMRKSIEERPEEADSIAIERERRIAEFIKDKTQENMPYLATGRVEKASSSKVIVGRGRTRNS